MHRMTDHAFFAHNPTVKMRIRPIIENEFDTSNPKQAQMMERANVVLVLNLPGNLNWKMPLRINVPEHIADKFNDQLDGEVF